jgi:quinolinate synthase
MTFTAQSVFDRLASVKIGGNVCLFSMERCEQIAPLLNYILELKRQKDAILLAHSYVSPELLLVADFVGDSYELSKKAQQTNAKTIVFSAVKFMAETAKILNPTKQVLVPNTLNGCSLADSITAEQVHQLRQQYPDYTFVCYINTTADVKAACDVCVTSSNCIKIIEDIPNQNIYFLPDKLMAKNVANALAEKGVKKNILWWEGTCYVHEAYDPEMIQYIRLQHPGIKVVTHPECSEDVVKESDFVGSTSQMIDYVKKTPSEAFFMLTECGLSSRLQLENPDVKFVGTCTMCKYMKSNTLNDIIRVLENPTPNDIIVLDEGIQEKALHTITEMFRYAEG